MALVMDRHEEVCLSICSRYCSVPGSFFCVCLQFWDVWGTHHRQWRLLIPKFGLPEDDFQIHKLMIPICAVRVLHPRWDVRNHSGGKLSRLARPVADPAQALQHVDYRCSTVLMPRCT
jgi:hypothetical protein